MSINKQLHFVSFFLFLTGWALAGSVEAATRGLQIEVRNAAGQIESKDLYSGYYALVIGIGEYDEWPDLPNAVSDAAEVASMLMNFGWDVELVANPTGYELEKSLFSLAKRARTDTELGILVWYSGHGWTLPEYDGTPLGYLVPSDAPDPKKDEVKFEQTAVDMRTIESVSRRIRSKHVLMVFDSCFSGSVFTLQRSNIPTPYIQDKTLKHVRQYITAGQEDEMVPDESIFQVVFMQGVKDRYADQNEDGYVTGNELGAYLQEKVINYSNRMQHPQYGKINDPKLDKGDFVFILPKIDASNLESGGSGGSISKPIDPRVLDLEYWKSIQKLNDPDLFLAYLRAFPEGIYAGLAKIKLQELGVASAALLQEEKKRREADVKRQTEEKKKREAEAKRHAEEKKKREVEEAKRQLINSCSSAFGAMADEITDKVYRNWAYAGQAIGVEVVISVKVSRSGEVAAVKVVEGSGDPIFDRSALNALRKASPLPFPDDPRCFEHFKEFNFIFSPDG